MWVLLVPERPLATRRPGGARGSRGPGDVCVDAGPAPHRREVDDAGRVLARDVLLRLVRRAARPGVVGHGAHLRQPPVPRGQRAGPDRPRRCACGGSAGPRPARAIPAVGLLSLLLFFGRPTLGSVIDLLPGRRRTCSCAATSPVCIWPASTWRGSAARGWGRRSMHLVRTRAGWVSPAFAAAALGVAADRRGRAGGGRALLVRADRRRVDRGAARRASRPTAPTSPRSSRRPRRPHPAASTAACARTRSAPKILFVPAFAALLNLDADAVGFTRPTWSLMSNVENRFAAHVAAQVDMFGVRWAILPSGRDPARRIGRSRRPPAGGCSGRRATSATSRWSTRWRPSPWTGRTSARGWRGSSARTCPLQGRYPTLAFGGRARRRSDARSGGRPDDPAGERGVGVRAARRRALRRRRARRPDGRRPAEGVVRPTLDASPSTAVTRRPR